MFFGHVNEINEDRCKEFVSGGVVEKQFVVYLSSHEKYFQNELYKKGTCEICFCDESNAVRKFIRNE